MSDGRQSAVRIGARDVGDGHPVFVVAEAGSNHNGSFERALELIDIAAGAAADAVKFQTFKASRLYPRSAGRSGYLKLERDIYEVIKEMEMPEGWVPRLAEHCADNGIAFLSSPFDEASADLIAPYVPAFKMASYEMTHAPLLRHVARFQKPMLISTGTATLAEVRDAVRLVEAEGNDQIVVLQCTAAYPAPVEALNLRAMEALREATGHAVGFSDHSRDPVVGPVAAVSLGACVIEKHFTVSNQLPGPDHKFAVEPAELSRMVEAIRATEKALGHGRKETLEVERELHAFARRSIFALEHISRGAVLGPHNVAVLRCGEAGFGLAPDEYERILGRRASCDIPAEALITFAHLE